MSNRLVSYCVLAAALSLTACAANSAASANPGIQQVADERPVGFPATCSPNEVQVMLFGTFHFEGSERDLVSGAPVDMLGPSKQAQLEDLAARLAAWKPDLIAVEWPATFADSTTARFKRYVANGGSTKSSNEVYQVGFRLARKLGHPTVYPIDYQIMLGNDSIAPLKARRPDLQKKEDSVIAELKASAAAQEKESAGWSLIQKIAASNTEKALHAGNSGSMFSYLFVGEGNNYGGPQLLARWYERNFYMVHNLTRVLRPETRRVLMIVGSGHVPPLRNILDESANFCPVSPLPLLR